MRLSQIKKLIFLFLPILIWSGEISSKIESIPSKDREILEGFFKHLISFEPFAYVIFGDKPIAISGYKNVSQIVSKISINKNGCSILGKALDAPFAKLNTHNLKMIHGFKTWEKYRALFPMQNYAILECDNLILNDYRCIMIINKKAFLETVTHYLSDFKAVLGEEMMPSNLLERFQTKKNIFRGVLKNNEILIGIIFGFGQHNARLYQERKDLMNCKLIRLEDCPQKLKGFNTSGFPINSLMLNLPRFTADLDHPETKELKRKYHKQYQEILVRYKSGDFLEITLQQLCKD